jgi:3-isopropylmalate/(R)-2-methylmalate dehydratase large subunit
MSGKTAFQKIVDSHCVKTLSDGRLVLKLDRVWGHEITTPNAIIDAKARGCDVVFDPNKVKTMIDHVNPAKDTASAIQGQMVREWSKEHGIEFLDVGRNGVCHAVIPEKGWIRPGEIGIMGDSHTCTHGAFCAFAAGVGTTELEAGIITGLWVCPPQKVIRVNFVGTLPANVYAKDLILTLIGKIGVKGATNAVLEFGGPVIEEMSMESRMTMTNMAVEAGATSGMMMVDQITIDYLGLGEASIVNWRHSPGFWNSDPDADYDQVIEIDVTGMVPVITDKYSPGEVVKVSDMAGKLVNQVYIGSCTNGRLEDLRIAATIFRLMGRKVADNVRCVVVPATQHIWEMALQEGLLEIFAKAGCFVSGPTCGACLGMSCGVIAPGEVCVSTTNRNFPGRMGQGGMVHLASPATAAMTALNGVVSEASAGTCSVVAREMYLMLAQKLTSVTGWTEVPSQRPNYTELLTKFGVGEVKNFSGQVFYLAEANVDTDQIIPAKYLTETKKEVFGAHCLEDASIPAERRPKIFQSQILLAGENFGCGSSREHAPWALEGAGIRCVIAPSFARIFENNMFANGLLCITLPKDTIDSIFSARPESINVNLEDRTVTFLRPGGAVSLFGFGLSDYQKELIRNGGSVGVMVKMAAELQVAGLLD